MNILAFLFQNRSNNLPFWIPVLTVYCLIVLSDLDTGSDSCDGVLCPLMLVQTAVTVYSVLWCWFRQLWRCTRTLSFDAGSDSCDCVLCPLMLVQTAVMVYPVLWRWFRQLLWCTLSSDAGSDSWDGLLCPLTLVQTAVTEYSVLWCWFRQLLQCTLSWCYSCRPPPRAGLGPGTRGCRPPPSPPPGTDAAAAGNADPPACSRKAWYMLEREQYCTYNTLYTRNIKQGKWNLEQGG